MIQAAKMCLGGFEWQGEAIGYFQRCVLTRFDINPIGAKAMLTNERALHQRHDMLAKPIWEISLELPRVATRPCAAGVRCAV
jgi:hypothetical protein